jgi:hypothetical protein
MIQANEDEDYNVVRRRGNHKLKTIARVYKSLYKSQKHGINAEDILAEIRKSKHLNNELFMTDMNNEKYEEFLGELKALPISIQKKKLLLQSVELNQQQLRKSLSKYEKDSNLIFSAKKVM